MSVAAAAAAATLPLTEASHNTGTLEKTTAATDKPAAKAPAKSLTRTKTKHMQASLRTDAPTELIARKGVKAAAPSEDEWEYLGEAKFVDGFSMMAYTGESSEPYDVPAYKSKTQSNTYLLQNIYPTSYLSDYDLYEWTDGLESSVTLSYTTDEKVLGTFDIHLTDISDSSKLSVTQQYYGTHSNGTFTFAERAYIVSYDGQPYVYSGEFTIALPGAEDLSLSFTTDQGLCTPDNKLTFTLDMGADSKGLKFLEVEGLYYPSAGNLGVTLNYGADVTPDTYTYTFPSTETGWHTLFACTVSEAGTVGQGGALYYYVQPEFDESAWYSLGEVDFTDDTFLPLCGISDIYTYKVELYEDKTTEGRFCLVDPYGKHPLSDGWGNHGHEHMLYVDATQTEDVSIALQPMGVVLGSEDDFALESSEGGTLADGKITFPTKGLTTIDKDMNTAWYANQSGKFAIEVPDLVTVTVTCDGAPVADAFVNYADWSGEGVYTDAAGVAYMPVKAGSDAELMAYKDGYDMVTFSASGEGRHKTAEVALTEAMATLTVMVFDADYEPVAGATVSFMDKTATTSANGNAQFGDIPAAEVIGTNVPVAVTAAGYRDWSGEADFTETMEAYLTVTMEKDDAQTSVSTVKVTIDKPDTVFDINGRRVARPASGAVYIINGKKELK